MSNAKRCDFCGSYYDPFNSVPVSASGKKILFQVTYRPVSYMADDQELDMCAECQKKLYECMYKKPD